MPRLWRVTGVFDIKATRRRERSKLTTEMGLGKYSGLAKGVAKAPEIAEDDMKVMFATNVTGLIDMTQAILPSMLNRTNGEGSGDIINIGSIAGREPYVVRRWWYLLRNQRRCPLFHRQSTKGTDRPLLTEELSRCSWICVTVFAS